MYKTHFRPRAWTNLKASRKSIATHRKQKGQRREKCCGPFGHFPKVQTASSNSSSCICGIPLLFNERNAVEGLIIWTEGTLHSTNLDSPERTIRYDIKRQSVSHWIKKKLCSDIIIYGKHVRFAIDVIEDTQQHMTHKNHDLLTKQDHCRHFKGRLLTILTYNSFVAKHLCNRL